jgi:tetratricopeptide (TPR) repeat protein
MKNFNFKLFSVMLITAVIVSGCGFRQMVKNYERGVSYTPEVNPLENHGGQVAARVKGDILDGYFHRKAVLELTPVLKHEGGEEVFPTLTLRGSRTTTEGTMVSRDRASSFHLNNVVAFQPEMLASELYVRARIYKEGQSNNATVLEERKVADGVINTSQLVMHDQEPFLAPHGYEKETIITKKGNIYFAYMRHNLDMRLALNRQPEAQAALKEVEDQLKKEWEIRTIEVNAWASPEGEVAFNEKLAESRSKTGERYALDMYRRLDREMGKSLNLPAPVVSAKGEDFEGFMTKLNASNLPDKQAIANVINSQIAPAERERRIKDMTLIYAEIEKILEPLRRAELVLQVYEPKKTDQEMMSLAVSNPSQLDEKELLYAATLHNNMDTKLNIYKSAQRLFPNSYKGYNNAAYVYINKGDNAAAASELERANQLSPGMPCVQNNLGILAARAGDDASAKSFYEAAKARGLNSDYNLGISLIRQGVYQAALNGFAGHTCKYNVALAQYLNGNADAALSTLNCAPESAKVSYLKAIIYSNRDNASQMYENLGKAIQQDPSLKAVAKKDRQFIRYFSASQFQNLVN